MQKARRAQDNCELSSIMKRTIGAFTLHTDLNGQQLLIPLHSSYYQCKVNVPVQDKCSRKRLANICLSKNYLCASPSLPLFIGSLYSRAKRSTGYRHLPARRGARWGLVSHKQPHKPPGVGPGPSSFSAITGDHKPVRGETQGISHAFDLFSHCSPWTTRERPLLEPQGSAGRDQRPTSLP